MKITYLQHSGFAVEFDNFAVLFDVISTPPQMDVKKIYVLASHSHGDHFSDTIFSLSNHYDATFILSDDIELTATQKTDQVFFVSENNNYDFEDFQLRVFGSTDLGVSFYVETKETTLFHSGDLNWWHWYDDTDENNRAMEEQYKKYIAQLSGLSIYAAFLPVDSRLQNAYDYGLRYFIDNVHPNIVIPMHFWNDFASIKKLPAQFGTDNLKVLSIHHDNEVIYNS